MRPLRLILLFSGFTVHILQAQHSCITGHLTRQLRCSNSAYDSLLLHTFNQLTTAQSNLGIVDRNVRTIPVVVHVLYNTPTGLFTDAAIENMIQQMNEDFRLLNSGLQTARPVVQPLATDVSIEFCLAKRRPDGKASSGINRVYTSQTCFDPLTQTNAMKSAATGGADPWNPLQYLNIWVCNIACGQASGVSGYAYIPVLGNGVHGSVIDGIVIDNTLGMEAFRHTWTHEAGHYLGLHHTWGDLPGNACGNVFPDTDDGFSDTPDSKDPNFNCSPVTSCPANSPYGDQFENFMDYSACPSLFTSQQSTYMNAMLTNVRTSLLSSTACNATGFPLANFTVSKWQTCAGTSIQFADLSVGSGLQYVWQLPGGSPSSSTDANPTVLYNTPGLYHVQLLVTNGQDTSVMNLPNAIRVLPNPTINISINQVKCFGENSGSATLQAGGTLAPYRYNWSTGDTISALTSLTAGVYSFTVTDQRSCSVNGTIQITQPTSPLSVNIQVQDAICGQSLGSASATVIGGSGTYTYSWSNNSTTTSSIVAPAGVYSVTASDGNNCTVSANAIINESSAPTATLQATNADCNTLPGLQININGGVPPYTFQWNTGDTSLLPAVIAPGFYSVTITDAQPCQSFQTVTIQDNSLIQATTLVTPTSVTTPTGSIAVTASGGAEPYSYTWSNGSTDSLLTNLPGGSYFVTITDANGCVKVMRIQVPAISAIHAQVQLTDIDPFPNPFNTAFNVPFAETITDLLECKLYTIDGKQLNTSIMKLHNDNMLRVALNEPYKGVLILTVEDAAQVIGRFKLISY